MLLAKKIFEFHARVQKCHFGNFSCAWNSKIFWAKRILLKHYENGNKKFFSSHVPGTAKSRIYAGKSTKRGFSLMSNDEKNFLPIFQILHIKNVWFLLELAMALVTSIAMKFVLVCYMKEGCPIRLSKKVIHWITSNKTVKNGCLIRLFNKVVC